MAWSYLFVYSPAGISEQQLKNFVDNHPDIGNWYRCLPNSFFLISEEVSSTLSNAVKRQFPQLRFIILDTGVDRNGWLPRAAWEFMRSVEDPKK
jgi:hypothetical protein